VKRCLREKGLFVLSTPNADVTSPVWNTPFNKYHRREYRPDQLRDLVETVFERVEILGQRTLNPQWKRLQRRYYLANFAHPFLTRHVPRPIKDAFLGFSLQKERVYSNEFVIDKKDVKNSWCIVAIATM
jgi:hypothetical protein